ISATPSRRSLRINSYAIAQLSFGPAECRTIGSPFARCLLLRYRISAILTGRTHLMARIGTRIGLSLGLALIALAPMSATAQDAHSIVQANAVKWAPAPPALPKGAQIAVMAGDPGKEGPFAIRLKFPAGYKVPPH